MRTPLLLLAVGGGTLAQSTVVPLVGLQGVVADLPLVMTVLLALRRGPELGSLMGFGLGLAQDAVIGSPLGVQALAKALAGFAAGELPRWCVLSNPVVPLGATVLLTVADGTVRFLLLQLFAYPAPFGELLAGVILPQAGLNALLALLAWVLPARWVRA